MRGMALIKKTKEWNINKFKESKVLRFSLAELKVIHKINNDKCNRS